MASADVAVIGGGLAGLSCAVALAERGASVFVAAKGMAATHWTHGGLDIAAPAGATTVRDGVARLATDRSHPYAGLAAIAPSALDEHLARLAAMGHPYAGGFDAPLVPIPTAIGTLRPAGTLPVAQAALFDGWRSTGLLLVGFGRYRDAWPALAAGNLVARQWPLGPARTEAREVELPGLAGLHNLNALTLARLFDDAAWRGPALRAIAGAIPPGAWRVGVPAVLGLADHRAALEEATAAFGAPPFEMVSVPPSVPGLRVYEGLRRRLLDLGGRLHWGFPVVDVERDGDRVTAIHTEGAARTLRIAPETFVLASGGIGGGGLRGRRDGTLEEPILGLPVSAPPRAAWLDGDLYGAGGVALESAGILVDDELRPIGPGGDMLVRNVRVVGSALAGMRYLAQRCGDGVALASGHRAARLVMGETADERAAAGVAHELHRRGGSQLPGLLDRQLHQVQRVHHGLSGRARHRPVPRAEVRGTAGPALPGRVVPGCERRLVQRLWLLHARLSRRRAHRRDEQPRAGTDRRAARHEPAQPGHLRHRPAHSLRCAACAARQPRDAQPAGPLARRGRGRHPPPGGGAALRQPDVLALVAAAPGRRRCRSGTTVVYFHGCAVNGFEPSLGRDTVEVLERNGYTVICPSRSAAGCR